MELIIHVNSVIVNEENRILLVQERKPLSYGKYNLPGGHLETTEKLVDGVKRDAIKPRLPIFARSYDFQFVCLLAAVLS